MALGGRPKEEGGHKPLKISVEKFVANALEKVGNKSQFIEKVVRPVLKKLDPGEASFFLWQIDAFISRGIIEAAKNSNFEQVQALGWLAGQLEDARKLCGLPQKTQESISTEQYEKRLDAIRHENLSDPTLAYVDLLFFMEVLPPHIKEKVIPEIQQVTLAITMASKTISWQPGQMQERKKRVMAFCVLYFLNRISALLHA